MQNIISKIKNIKLVVFDVDGVMTNGDISYCDDGREIKTFNAKDGQGLSLLPHYGYITAIITARKSDIVERRAKDLGITHVYQGAKNKLEALNELLKIYNLELNNVCYMGDDLPDLCILDKAGLSCCPHDAVDRVKEISMFVSSKDGGRGAIRELCDLLIDNSSSSER